VFRRLSRITSSRSKPVSRRTRHELGAISALDRYALVSSSRCHSPEKLGREANLFDCDLSYFAMRDALRERGAGFLGTLEFFPEEGKYHADGHRKCDVVMTPDEAAACDKYARAAESLSPAACSAGWRRWPIGLRVFGLRAPSRLPAWCHWSRLWAKCWA